jgi:hypothetical protein
MHERTQRHPPIDPIQRLAGAGDGGGLTPRFQPRQAGSSEVEQVGVVERVSTFSKLPLAGAPYREGRGGGDRFGTLLARWKQSRCNYGQ